MLREEPPPPFGPLHYKQWPGRGPDLRPAGGPGWQPDGGLPVLVNIMPLIGHHTFRQSGKPAPSETLSRRCGPLAAVAVFGGWSRKSRNKTVQREECAMTSGGCCKNEGPELRSSSYLNCYGTAEPSPVTTPLCHVRHIPAPAAFIAPNSVRSPVSPLWAPLARQRGSNSR